MCDFESSKFQHIKRTACSEIVAVLNDSLIGQQEAKETLPIAVFNHYQRLEQKKPMWRFPKVTYCFLAPQAREKHCCPKLSPSFWMSPLPLPLPLPTPQRLTQAGYMGLFPPAHV
jgi:ATP-dependent protease Clp ATPase subunit